MTRQNIPSEEGAPESALREAVKTTTYLPQEWVYDNFKVRGVSTWSGRNRVGRRTGRPCVSHSHLEQTRAGGGDGH